MRYVLLADGTRINNCTDSTTSDNIAHEGNTYADAAGVLDVITPENAVAVRVYDENDEEVASGGNLVLNAGGSLAKVGDKAVCTVTLRHKSESEIMKEEIAELQEAVLG